MIHAHVAIRCSLRSASMSPRRQLCARIARAVSFHALRHLAAVGDDHGADRAVAAVARAILNLGDQVHAVQNRAEHDVLAIQPRCETTGAGQRGRGASQQCTSGHARVTTVVMKNWLPLVLGPALAMDSRPGTVCLCTKFSSANLLP